VVHEGLPIVHVVHGPTGGRVNTPEV
jgi:hypothetical protein